MKREISGMKSAAEIKHFKKYRSVFFPKTTSASCFKTRNKDGRAVRHHSLSTFAKFSEKCCFSENFAKVLNEWSLCLSAINFCILHLVSLFVCCY